MSLFVLIGGARSGKSSIAQRMALRHGKPVMVAVFGCGEGDSEMAARIERHRVQRPAEFATIESPDGTDWVADVPEEAVLLVDCLGTAVAKIMQGEWASAEPDVAFIEAGGVSEAYAVDVEKRVGELVEALCKRSGETLVVTNEVGSGVVPVSALGRLFRDVVGRANREMTSAAKGAWLVVAGRCVDLAHLPETPEWD